MLERARAPRPGSSESSSAPSPASGSTVSTTQSRTCVVCYLVLQHLPSRAAVLAYLAEFARVLKPGGEAFVQLPVLDDGLRPRAWRAVRSALVPLTSLGPTRRREFRGFRLTRDELDYGPGGASDCASSRPTSARTRPTASAAISSSG